MDMYLKINVGAISRYRMAEEKLGIAFRRRGVQGGLLK